MNPAFHQSNKGQNEVRKMNKFTLMILLVLGLWVLPASTSRADGRRMHWGGTGAYYGFYPGSHSFYSPSWYYFHRPHYYYGHGGYSRYRGRVH